MKKIAKKKKQKLQNQNFLFHSENYPTFYVILFGYNNKNNEILFFS